MFVRPLVWERRERTKFELWVISSSNRLQGLTWVQSGGDRALRSAW